MNKSYQIFERTSRTSNNNNDDDCPVTCLPDDADDDDDGDGILLFDGSPGRLQSACLVLK